MWITIKSGIMEHLLRHNFAEMASSLSRLLSGSLFCSFTEAASPLHTRGSFFHELVYFLAFALVLLSHMKFLAFFHFASWRERWTGAKRGILGFPSYAPWVNSRQKCSKFKIWDGFKNGKKNLKDEQNWSKKNANNLIWQ